MSATPAFVWLDWREANRHFAAYDEPPLPDVPDCTVLYQRADLAAADAARIAELERQLAEARDACNQSRLAFSGFVSVDSALRKLDNLSALKDPKPRFTDWPEEDFDITVGKRKETP